MRILFTTILFLLPYLVFSQITFEEVLSLEKKSFQEIQAYFITDYNIVENTKQYYYFPLRPCNPPEYFEDNCTWKCTTPDYLDAIKSKYPISKVVFKKANNKNYEMWITLKSLFAENFNSTTKKARTFIEVSQRISWANNNCKTELIEGAGQSIPLSINIQFSDPEHWRSFKSSIANTATFQETWKPNDDSPTEFRFGIRRQKINDTWKGVYINFYEDGPVYHASISFDSYGVD
jgi:hypothetical protein